MATVHTMFPKHYSYVATMYLAMVLSAFLFVLHVQTLQQYHSLHLDKYKQKSFPVIFDYD